MPEPDDLTPEEEQVRRLLADARHTLPVPDDVASRLDEVLADLRDEDPTAPVPVAVTHQPLDLAAARRRRHNVRSWLVAAAAVVVVGVGINQVVQMDGSGDDAASGDSAESADRPDAAAGGDQSASERGTTSEAPSAGSANAPSQDDAVPAAPVRLDPDRFGTQVTRIRERSEAARTDDLSGTFSLGADDGTLANGLSSVPEAYGASCSTSGWGHGHAVLVRYGGQPGVLVFRPVRGDTQVVDLFLCGSDHPERSITLPAP